MMVNTPVITDGEEFFAAPPRLSREGGQRTGGTQIAVMPDDGLGSLNAQINVAENEALDESMLDQDDLERAETYKAGEDLNKNSMLS